MKNIEIDKSVKKPFRDLLAYSSAEGGISMTQNSIWAASMLFYTQVLGLSAAMAGLALSATMLLDALADPIMGHITDNTKSRFGRRHQYILIGGILMVVSYFFMWNVPNIFRGPNAVFWYVMVICLLVRLTWTVMSIPYAALGFEICTDYVQRAELQSVRFIVNMTANILGCALGWKLFFKDQGDIDGTSIESNYVHMGTALSIASLVLILICVFTTRKYMKDNRKSAERVSNTFKSFVVDFKGILIDKRAIIVFMFFAFAQLGMVLVSSIQMYTYVLYMKFPALHKTIVHGSSMAGFAIGAMLLTLFVKKFDKKPTVFIASCISITANIILLLIFTTGFMKPGMYWNISQQVPMIGGLNVPISMIVFAVFHGLFWFGNGLLVPIVMSMIADISEINKYESGVLKDGSYAAVFSLMTKIFVALGLLMTGLLLDWAGFVAGAKTQTPEAVNRVAWLTFISGPIFILAGAFIVSRYKVNREYMMSIKKAIAERESFVAGQ